MMSCREVSSELSRGNLPQVHLGRRIEIWIHLAMCGSCRAFWRQLQAITRGLRAAAGRLENEVPPDLEAGVVARVLEAGPSSPASGGSRATPDAE